jgi:hypothetical protein
MLIGKLKAVTVVILAASLVVGTAALTQRLTAGNEPAKPTTTASQRSSAVETKPQPMEDKDSIAYSGRVLGPDGQPVTGAKLYISPGWGYMKRPYLSQEYATTEPGGRFQFMVPRAQFAEQVTVVAAMAAEYGAGWVKVMADGKKDDLTLRLVKDDMPINGQIVDLEGKPVPGATLRVQQIHAAPGEDLGPWLLAAMDKKAPSRGRSLRLEQKYLSHYTIALSPIATTDAEGRFQLHGIGRNRLVRAQLDGPTIVSQKLHILTRPGPTIEVPELEADRNLRTPALTTAYYGATFRHVAAPTKPIVGVVRDKDTKQLLAGVTVESYKMATSPLHGENMIQTKTDARGQYRLIGMPKGESNKIRLVPAEDQPYVSVHAVVPDSPSLEPVTVDFELKRGVWIEGKITDKATNKPVKASVEYFALYPTNPNVRDHPGFEGTYCNIIAAKEDGSYRIVGLPGPGLVGVYGRLQNYLRAPDRDDEFGVKEPSLSTSPYHISFTSNYSAIAPIDPAKGVETVKRDVTLDPGWKLTGTVLGPDGIPVTGVRSLGLEGPWSVMKTPEFTVSGFNPRRPLNVLFQHLEKGLVGALQPPKENGGAVTVQLEPGAVVTGRLVNAEGQPRVGAELEVTFRSKKERYFGPYSPEHIKTDREGRFRIEALLPECEFRLSDGKDELPLGEALHSGQTKDVGDVQMKRREE